MDDDFTMPYNSIYDHASGTSLAAPHVSGVAALILGQFPNLTLEQLRGRLLGTSDYIYDKNQAHLGLMGSGRLNAYRALTETEKPNLVLNGINVNGLPSDVIEIGSASQRLALNLKNWWSNATNVWGLLSTDDPNVSISYAGSNRIDWGNIQTEESIINEMYITIYATGFNRLATFTLTVDSDANNPKAMTFTMKLQTTIEEDYFCVIPPGNGGLEGSYLNKNFTAKDINDDGFDEIFVTSRNGYLFIIHQNGSFVRKQLTMGTTCTPAIGDVNSDTVLDIVVGDNNGIVHVFNGVYPYNLINPVVVLSDENKPLITFITLEDMNNDGQLDIVAVYEKTSSGDGANGFSIINMLDLQVYSNSITYTIQHGVSVDDVNGNGLKDVVYLCQNYNGLQHNQTNLYLDIVEVSEDFRFNQIYNNNIGNHVYDAGSSPIITDLNNDEVKEILIRYEWNNQSPDHLRSKKVGIKVYNYHPTSHTPLWEYPNGTGDDTVYHIVQNDNILVGDFSPEPGLEILFTSDKLYLLDANGYVIIESCMLPSEQSRYQEFILAFENPVNDIKYYRVAVCADTYNMSAYNTNFFENIAWKYNVINATINNPIGLAVINTSLSSCGIVLPMQNGQIAVIPVKRDDTYHRDYSRYRYNSRHTGSYNQPLPKKITDYTEVKHNLYIENDMYFESDVLIQPTVRIVVDPNVTIRVYELLSCIGNEADGLCIQGTCLSNNHSYWNGLVFRNGSSSDLRYCNIRNASVGVSYEEKGLHLLEQCLINHNEWGLGIYQANPILKNNRIIQNSDIGIALNNGAIPLIGEDTDIAGYNSIFDNNVGIFSSQSKPLLQDGHNDIVNAEYNIQLAFTVDEISAQHNWWGLESPEEITQKFNLPELVLFDPWDGPQNTPYTPQSNPFVLAMQLMSGEQYQQAIALFHQVLADSVLSNDDHASINALLICYDKTNHLTYYKGFILNQLDNDLPEKMVHWYKDCLALIDRSMGLFGNAIAYYESKLDNSSTLADSCYALIDLGNTYLEADNKACGKYSHLIPKSIQEHARMAKGLLDKIYQSSSEKEVIPPVEQVLLRQNYPNPFNPTTTISFYLPEKTQAQLTIYNVKGQVVKTIKNEVMNKGSHSEVWDGKDSSGRVISSGVYFYKLRTSKTTLVRKMLMLK
jgi:hypothetical protein